MPTGSDNSANDRICCAGATSKIAIPDPLYFVRRARNFKDTKPQTQRIYRGELERFRATYGNRTVAGMNAKHVANLLTKIQATPSAANNLKKRLGQLFDFAILMGMRNDNPARVVRKSRTGGCQTWQEEQIAAFQARWPIGTQERLAFDLALYTGQRKSDVCRMGCSTSRRGASNHAGENQQGASHSDPS